MVFLLLPLLLLRPAMRLARPLPLLARRPFQPRELDHYKKTSVNVSKMNNGLRILMTSLNFTWYRNHVIMDQPLSHKEVVVIDTCKVYF